MSIARILADGNPVAGAPWRFCLPGVIQHALSMYTCSMQRQVIVELDAATSAELERVAPARNRMRSEFIRAAIRRALDEAAEKNMADAYRRLPDGKAPHFDAREWEPDASGKGRRVRRKG